MTENEWKKLVEDEVEWVELEYLASSFAPRPSSLPADVIRRQVRKAMEVHRERIEKWGGFYLRGPVAEGLKKQLDGDAVRRYLDGIPAAEFEVPAKALLDDSKGFGAWARTKHGYTFARAIHNYGMLRAEDPLTPIKLSVRASGDISVFLSRCAGGVMSSALQGSAWYALRLQMHRQNGCPVVSRGVCVVEPDAVGKIGTKVTKILSRAAAGHSTAGLPTDGSPESAAFRQACNRVMAKICEGLGQLLAAQDMEALPVLSVRPRDWLLLGSMGENGSCYQRGGQYEQSKMTLMTWPGSVVVKFLEKGRWSSTDFPLGRAWGWWDERSGLVYGNVYNVTIQQAAMLTGPLVRAELGLDKLEEDEVVERELGAEREEPTALKYGVLYRVQGLYVNGDEVRQGKRELLDVIADWGGPEDVLITCRRCDVWVAETELGRCENCGYTTCPNCRDADAEYEGLCRYCGEVRRIEVARAERRARMQQAGLSEDAVHARAREIFVDYGRECDCERCVHARAQAEGELLEQREQETAEAGGGGGG